MSEEHVNFQCGGKNDHKFRILKNIHSLLHISVSQESGLTDCILYRAVLDS